MGDKIGRVRAMALSIFTYSIFTGLCGFATEAVGVRIVRLTANPDGSQNLNIGLGFCVILYSSCLIPPPKIR